ncbi:MAG: ABC transporter permease, partial [Ekhidna sp.]
NFLILAFLLLIPNSYSELVLGSTILFLLVFIQFQLFRESTFLSPIPLGNKYQKSTLSPTIKASILEKLDRVVGEEKFYLRDDASLTNLATELGTTTHHLSQVLNDSLKISFQDLIARFRIREACQLLKDETNDQVKIENIANQVGYNSKSAFNTAFKKRTGLTPSEYREAKGVLIYGEERLSERKEPSSTLNSLHLNHVFNLKISGDMIQHFFKVFSRNMKRNGLFSLLNIFGLTVGFTCSILIYLFLQDELSFDSSIPDADRIYRIAWMSDNSQTRTPHPMAQAMVNDFPEVEEAVSLSPWYGPGLSKDLIRVENVKRNIIFEEPDFYFADSTFFDVFNLELVEGDKDAMKKPFSLVISEPLAKKYFGDSSAIGKELKLNDMPIAVSAVVKPMPENSHFHFNAFIPYVTLKQINPKDGWMTWADFGHFNYLKLKKGADAASLEAKIPDWVAGYLDWNASDLDRLHAGEFKFELQPIQDIHLTSHLRWELENNGNILYIYILSFTLAFLLLIATINYVNLTTAKSVERAKEIGVRKTLGAVSKGLSFQFYLESIIFSFISMVISIVLAGLLLDSFNLLSGKQFYLSDLIDSAFLIKAIFFCLVTGLLAGLYPALVLSTFKPAEVLKGKLSTSSKGIRLRSILVIVQFTISAILISGSLIVFRQVQFMQETDLGFDKDAVISLNVPVSIELGGVDLNALRTVQDLLSTVSGVHSTALVSSAPGGQFNQHPYYLKSDPENSIDASSIMVDYDIEKVLGFETVKGRTFDRSFASDSLHNVLINESMASMLNNDELIGKTIVQNASGNLFESKIIGIVKDFHFQSLHQKIQPLLMSVQPLGAGNILVKLEGQSFAETMNQIEAIYMANIKTDLPFEYEFIDQQLAQLYKQEEQTLSIFSVFALIALIIASLGLLGMALAILNQRVKEVGMRKILGATSAQIMQMIFGQFLKLIVVALVIGLPLSYLLMQNWVNEFSYQAPFGIMPFVWSAIILLTVAAISVSSAVSKIAFSNPVDSLKYE